MHVQLLIFNTVNVAGTRHSTSTTNQESFPCVQYDLKGPVSRFNRPFITTLYSLALTDLQYNLKKRMCRNSMLISKASTESSYTLCQQRAHFCFCATVTACS